MRHSEPVGMTFSFNIDDSASALTVVAKVEELFCNTCFVLPSVKLVAVLSAITASNACKPRLYPPF